MWSSLDYPMVYLKRHVRAKQAYGVGTEFLREFVLSFFRQIIRLVLPYELQWTFLISNYAMVNTIGSMDK